MPLSENKDEAAKHPIEERTTRRRPKRLAAPGRLGQPQRVTSEQQSQQLAKLDAELPSNQLYNSAASSSAQASGMQFLRQPPVPSGIVAIAQHLKSLNTVIQKTLHASADEALRNSNTGEATAQLLTSLDKAHARFISRVESLQKQLQLSIAVAKKPLHQTVIDLKANLENCHSALSYYKNMIFQFVDRDLDKILDEVDKELLELHLNPRVNSSQLCDPVM